MYLQFYMIQLEHKSLTNIFTASASPNYFSERIKGSRNARLSQRWCLHIACPSPAYTYIITSGSGGNCCTGHNNHTSILYQLNIKTGIYIWVVLKAGTERNGTNWGARRFLNCQLFILNHCLPSVYIKFCYVVIPLLYRLFTSE